MKGPRLDVIGAVIIGACLLVMIVGFLFHIGWNWLDKIHW